MTTGERELKTVSETSLQAPYPTDGSDYRGAVRHHYTTVMKRYLKVATISLPLWLQLFVFKIEWLLPVAIAGFFGVMFSTLLYLSRMSWVWRCSRIFRTYPLQFRGPVEKVHQGRERKILIRFGRKGSYTSPVMRALEPLTRTKAPGGMADGVWFAGDDPFGGAAIVPGTGELLFMQPKEWDVLSEQRRDAGAERLARAKRARLRRRVPNR
jgi:hypothetical protein